MVSVSEVFKEWQEAFANKDSSNLAEFFTDDFQLVFAPDVIRNKQEALDWISAGGSPTTIDNLEVLYENYEAAATHHSANNNASLAMVLYTKKDGKFSQARVVRTAV